MKFKQFIEDAQRTLPDLHELYSVDYINMRVGGLHYFRGDEKEVNSELFNEVHMVLGMCGEMDEILEAIASENKANLLEELVDTLWYIACDIALKNRSLALNVEEYIRISSFEFADKLMIINQPKSLFERLQVENSTGNKTMYLLLLLQYNLGKLVDGVKKDLAYNKPNPYVHDLYISHITSILYAINNLAIIHHLDLEEGMDRVIAKLKQRYPDKFSAENAQNRDLEKERKIIEGNSDQNKE